MITILDGYPDNVLAFTATGHVAIGDYRDVLIPEAEARLQRHEKLRFLYRIGEDFEGFDPGALLADAGFGLKHPGQLGRTAIVTDINWIAEAARLLVPFFHMPVRVFSNQDFEEARAWVLSE